jgi:hypothetical protein
MAVTLVLCYVTLRHSQSGGGNREVVVGTNLIVGCPCRSLAPSEWKDEACLD